MPYMQNFRDKVQCSLHIMHNKKRTAQEKAKEHYDKFAREVCCEPGDLVLVLQPLAGKPLSLKYVGPYRVLRKTSPVDYIVEFKGHSKVERNLQVNMLTPYFTRTEFVKVVMHEKKCDDCVDYSYFIKPNENVN